jgi:ATP adenylyltransferase
MDSEQTQRERLWAPWRVEYFEKPVQAGFLEVAGREVERDGEHLVLARRAHCFLMMNRYPYSVGHLMVVPYRKVADLSELHEAERLELWELAELGQCLLRKVVRAQGFNVGLNLGKCAGAGVVDHLHLHVVPRWEGDHNFMPVLSGNTVLSEALESLYARLRSALSLDESESGQ